ncbi:hypothetical protein DFA_07870 [Cavenderia fasciculata]|uniref:Uncharacterized protein n=1 Tax=Cavenderia fasciculata TaxID=261658 RepID=F4Q3S3_CACFS|nr:uncharacterized protein DFA_07870 [Cavenderia fasciculata]EGG16889.1 hypothetical protein DFA_07870 [Cavenderia fasciculata]|eukprot:XP_004355363.1 hypothetical protein DFA_07870 [Cavenderia fasciculata]
MEQTDNNTSLSLSCLIQTTSILLPWVIQSEIIYILCTQRKNQDCKEIRPKDVFGVAGVSRKWRQATKASLTLNLRINISRQLLEDYRQHYDNSLSLLSGPNHHIEIVIDFGTGSSEDNLAYAGINIDWFNDTIINKMSHLKIVYTAPKWIKLIKEHRSSIVVSGGGDGATLLPPCFNKMSVQFVDLHSLFMFNHLKELDINFTLNISTEICSILTNCNTLESLTMKLEVSPNINMNQVFSSIPHSVTRLYWKSQPQTNSHNKATNPPPFHLLPPGIRHLLIEDHIQRCSQSYCDYVRANSVSTVVHTDHPTYYDTTNFLISLSSPVKHIYFQSSGFTVQKESAIVPETLEELDLQFIYIDRQKATDLLETIFKYPLPKLHTFRIEGAVRGIEQFPDFLVRFIESSQSLRIIDFAHSFFWIDNLNRLDLFLRSIADSPSIEKVYLRHTPGAFRQYPNQFLFDTINQHLQTINNNNNNNNPLLLILHDKNTIIIINTNNCNNNNDLSCYQ